MRIGSASFTGAQVGAMARLNDAIAREQTAISSGQRRAAPSDDPDAAARSALLSRTQANNARASGNLDLADQRLASMDSALGQMSNQFARLKELTLQASSETASAATRQTVLGEVTGIRDELVTLANARDGAGAYLFGGAGTGAPPFVRDPVSGATLYQGIGDAAPLSVGADAGVATIASGAKAFGNLPQVGGRSVFGVVDDLIATLALPDPAPTDDAGLAARRNALDKAVTGIGAASDRVADLRAGVGTGLNRVTSERDRLAADNDGLAAARSALDDTDYAAAITRLQRASTILQATQKSFAELGSLSLFNELH